MPRFFEKSGGAGEMGKSSALANPPPATSHERKRDRLRQFLMPHSGSPSPTPLSAVLQQAPSSNPSSSVLPPLPSSSSAVQQTPIPTSSSSVLQQSPSLSSNPSSFVLQRAPPPNPSTSVLQPAPFPIPSGSALPQAASPVPTTGGNDDLWTKAYNKLPDDLKQQLGVNKLGPADKLQTLQSVLQTAVQAKEANIANRLKFKWGDKEVDVQETANKLVGWITKFKEVGDIAVQYDPVHAALPWAGIRFILLLVVGDQEKLAAAILGMERVAVLIGRCAIYEQLYLTSDVPSNAEEATENLRQGLLTLYTAILQALCRLIRIFEGKLADKLKTPESTLADVSSIDAPDAVVNSAVIAVENCYNSATRQHSKKEFNALRNQLQEQHREQLHKLLKDFMPVLSKINKSVDEIFKHIQEHQRITILEWFSTVPYQSHHDLACEGRVEHTGAWLFKRKEFTSWQNSTAPAILWLHGIPGAGKTKLVSATIEYLKSTVQFDKVAFFYCKRDEANRRDRERILLSWIKQLACPPKNLEGRICADALEAYNREKKDPASRSQLNFDSALNLLGHLIECFQHPVVVLDALDECSEEVRSHLLRGLLSVISKAKCAFKVFISSRHNLDIETRLQDLPHVCIEARDNAEDIEHYVQKELTLATLEKRLLRGNMSQELTKYIEEIILRDANGMFLWVDWQLRELCKLMRESDIRARLGRLPKGLTGVYDEIITSIKSQPDCNFNLAIRALKWMLVSERPLRPQELVAAAELNPHISVNSTGPSQESTLPVELLIQSCEGLLLLDTGLNVVRFSHLSVQEYLETRSEIWDVSVIDAHLFVSESCLWTLQSSELPLYPLYKYARLNWFRHCRSYQDLVLSVVNVKDAPHKLSIPLLNTFLGSFSLAASSYAKWAKWVADYGGYASELRCILSTPLCPAFSVAFAGLGELVSWLWSSEGNNMKICNDLGESLLDVAIANGTQWMVEEMLRGDFESGDIQNALYPAAKTSTGIVKLLLDRGANINITSRNHRAALLAAAYKGNLDIVTLLLDRGADANLTEEGSNTALIAAAYRGGLDIVTLLLDRGADVNITGGDYGTALGAAALGGELEIVTLLLDRGADVNLTGGDYGTAVGAATSGGELEIVKLLLDRGANFNLANSEGAKPRDFAEQKGHLDIVDLLDSRCVNTKPDAPTDNNPSPIGYGADPSLNPSL